MRYRALKNDRFGIVDALLKAVANTLEKAGPQNDDKVPMLHVAINTLNGAEEMTSAQITNRWDNDREARDMVMRIRNLPERDKLETVAEEAAEVSQAALKLIRAKELSWNPTPMDSGEAWENLCDEIIDLCLALDVCRFDVAGFAGYASSSQNPKLKRWVDRLEKKEDAE